MPYTFDTIEINFSLPEDPMFDVETTAQRDGKGFCPVCGAGNLRIIEYMHERKPREGYASAAKIEGTYVLSCLNGHEITVKGPAEDGRGPHILAKRVDVYDSRGRVLGKVDPKAIEK